MSSIVRETHQSLKMIANESFFEGEALEEFNTKMVTESSYDHELHDSTHPELWYLNGTFHVIESTLSHAGILHIGGVGGVSLAVILGTSASLALMIRGTFIYYLKNYAPRGRALNRLMLFDQVSGQISYLIIRKISYSKHSATHKK